MSDFAAKLSYGKKTEFSEPFGFWTCGYRVVEPLLTSKLEDSVKTSTFVTTDWLISWSLHSSIHPFISFFPAERIFRCLGALKSFGWLSLSIEEGLERMRQPDQFDCQGGTNRNLYSSGAAAQGRCSDRRPRWTLLTDWFLWHGGLSSRIKGFYQPQWRGGCVRSLLAEPCWASPSSQPRCPRNVYRVKVGLRRAEWECAFKLFVRLYVWLHNKKPSE